MYVCLYIYVCVHICVCVHACKESPFQRFARLRAEVEELATDVAAMQEVRCQLYLHCIDLLSVLIDESVAL